MKPFFTAEKKKNVGYIQMKLVENKLIEQFCFAAENGTEKKTYANVS